MPPFKVHSTGLSGIKERIESAFVQGDRLFLGTATGDLLIYTLSDSDEEKLVETKKSLSRRPIDQLGFIKDVNSLVVLSDTIVTLWSSPEFKQSTPLNQSRGALAFAVNRHISNDNLVTPDETSKDIPAVLTRLVIGCKRKVVVFSWKDGEMIAVKEHALAHSPRAIAFVNSSIVCLSYSQTDQTMFSLEKMETFEIELPPTGPATNLGMGALTGFGGYMTLGLGSKERKPALVGLNGDEVLVPKDNTGLIIGADGKLSRSLNIEWPALPDENVFIKPYVLTALPPFTGTSKAGTTAITPTQTSTIQVTSTISLLSVQIINPQSFETVESIKPCTIRLLTSSQIKSSVYFFSTPIDRTAATAEGSRLWKLCMQSWNEQIDELVQKGSYLEALALLDSIDEALLPDKDQRRKHIKALHAVWIFSEGKYDDAMNIFISLDTNPAKVIALYPDSIAGRLSVPRAQWFKLHGGSSPTGFIEPTEPSTSSPQREANQDVHVEDTAIVSPAITVGQSPTVKSLWRVGRGGAISAATRKDDDAASIMSGKAKEKQDSDDRRYIESLYRFLTDRRPKLGGALSALHITPAQASDHSSLSSVSVEDILDLPNLPLPALTPDQLIRFAQIIDTALLATCLVIHPGLLGSLCRLPNWCEVLEVEQVLRAKGKLTELIDLYNGKKMHEKALALLREMSVDETDKSDKLRPTISYLQKLDSEYLTQIFDGARWVLDTDRDMGFEIFSSEERQLPQTQVANYLDKFDPLVGIRYIEFLIYEKYDMSVEFHERLAESYLRLSLKGKGNSQADSRLADEMYSKLLKFINESSHLQVDRLFGLLPSDDLFEARAILLGRLGKHEGALEIYVHRLKEYLKAEEYCKRTYYSVPDGKTVFLTLLRIYLRAGSIEFLKPALGLISRHSPRLDTIEALNLLPPMVPAQDLKAFLQEALRQPIFDTQVVKEIWKSREHQVSSSLVGLQARRVKITDSRICPQCHKRIGNSVIAVHAPRGEVTHYTCREAFAKKLHRDKQLNGSTRKDIL